MMTNYTKKCSSNHTSSLVERVLYNETVESELIQVNIYLKQNPCHAITLKYS